jgi:multidrug resistance efflux pump
LFLFLPPPRHRHRRRAGDPLRAGSCRRLPASQFTDNAYVRGQNTFISPQVNGYITEVKVTDLCRSSRAVLLQIDDRIYKQRVHQAQASWR